MTKAQEKAIDWIMRNCVELDFSYQIKKQAAGKYDHDVLPELLSWETIEYGSFVSVSTVCGWENPNGVMICKQRHWHVGVRGGLKGFGKKPKGKYTIMNKWSDFVIYGGEDIYCSPDSARNFYMNMDRGWYKDIEKEDFDV